MVTCAGASHALGREVAAHIFVEIDGENDASDQTGFDAAKMEHFLLSSAAMGQTVRLVRIDAGKRLTHRLTELGLTPGVELMLVHDSGGPLFLCVRDSRALLSGAVWPRNCTVDFVWQITY